MIAIKKIEKVLIYDDSGNIVCEKCTKHMIPSLFINHECPVWLKRLVGNSK